MRVIGEGDGWGVGYGDGLGDSGMLRGGVVGWGGGMELLGTFEWKRTISHPTSLGLVLPVVALRELWKPIVVRS